MTRFVLTVATIASLGNAVAFAGVPSWPMGKQLPGAYRAGGDHIRFVATHYRGEFNYDNIRQAFSQAVHAQRTENFTAAHDNGVNNGDRYGNQRQRLASDRHAVLGWINDRSNTAFFVGVRVSSNGKRYEYLTRDGKSGSGGAHFQDWDWRVNGYKVYLHFADDNNYGITWRFRGPK